MFEHYEAIEEIVRGIQSIVGKDGPPEVLVSSEYINSIQRLDHLVEVSNKCFFENTD